MTVRDFGFGISLTVGLLGLYEAVAIKTCLPTISRILQGWRDGPGSNVPVWVVVVLILTVINLFNAWLFHHLLFEARSTL